MDFRRARGDAGGVAAPVWRTQGKEVCFILSADNSQCPEYLTTHQFLLTGGKEDHDSITAKSSLTEGGSNPYSSSKIISVYSIKDTFCTPQE